MSPESHRGAASCQGMLNMHWLAGPLGWIRNEKADSKRHTVELANGDLTSVRGLGASIVLSRGRARNSDAFSPDDLHARIQSLELSAASSVCCLYCATYLWQVHATGILERQDDNLERRVDTGRDRRHRERPTVAGANYPCHCNQQLRQP